MNTPLVSVIVPVYNAEKHINMLIDSILAQTFHNFELLLINDGSKDRSPLIIDEYAQKDNRIRVFHKKNGGVSSARNYGLDQARGTFVTFADNDDYMFPNNLQTMVEAAYSIKEGYDLIICNFIRCKRNEISQCDCNRTITPVVCAKTQSEMPNAVIKMGYTNFVIWNQLFKRSIIERFHVRFRNENSEDELFSTEFFSCVNNFKQIDFKGYVFIIKKNSLGSTHKYITSYDWIRKMEDLYDIIIKKNSITVPNVHEYNWRIANRLSLLCLKGYFRDSHISFSERMTIWKTISNDKWLKNRINLSKMNWKIQTILNVAKYHLYFVLDPIFNIYGIVKSLKQ